MIGGALAAATVFSPQLAVAIPFASEEPPSSETRHAGEERIQLAEAQFETTTSVSVPAIADRTLYILGETAPVSATVRASGPEGGEDLGPPRGDVEFFDGEVSLGIGEVVADGSTGRATLETDRWPASGAREVTAVFTPDDGTVFAPSTSAARTYRVVDTARMVPDIELQSEAAASIDGASLEWTIANIWFSNFRVGFERQALSGGVSLPALPAPGSGASDEELQTYYFRPFTFSQGGGERDAEGNRVVSFEGAARLTSGSANQWDFADPRVHISPEGDGYVTAEFSGFYRVGESSQDYGPVRVTIATFSGAELSTSEGADGEATRVEAVIPLNWEGQARGAGTWFYDYDDSFPNEFVSLLNPLVSPFFVRSAVATDESKRPHPITLSFVETTAEDPGGEDPGDEDPGGPEEEPGNGSGYEGGGAGDERDGSDGTGTAGGSTVETRSRLAATGWGIPEFAALAAVALAAVLGGGVLLVRRRS